MQMQMQMQVQVQVQTNVQGGHICLKGYLDHDMDDEGENEGEDGPVSGQVGEL